MRYRTPKPNSKYYLPHHEYMSVVYFCLSYPAWKRELESFGGTKAVAYDGMPHGSEMGNPTERDGIRRADLAKKVELIENVVQAAAPDLYDWMLKAVTQGVPYHSLGIPCGVNQFSQLRRRIYFEVAHRK